MNIVERTYLSVEANQLQHVPSGAVQRWRKLWHMTRAISLIQL